MVDKRDRTEDETLGGRTTNQQIKKNSKTSIQNVQLVSMYLTICTVKSAVFFAGHHAVTFFTFFLFYEQVKINT